MKTTSKVRFLALFLAFGVAGTVVAQSGYSVVERGLNHQVFQKNTMEHGTNRIHRYTELATGLNYTNSAGQLTESHEQITPLPTGGASATQGQHKVYFPADIYNGVLQVTTPDGRNLYSRPLAVSYDDGSNTVFIATLTNAVGCLLSSNQVIYRNAFAGIRADIIATYRRGGFECDLVLRGQPPTPDVFGLDASYTTLQMVTEFFDTEDPAQIPAASDEWFGLQDTIMKFGKLTMTRGRAFAFNGTNAAPTVPGAAAPVYKSWLHAADRTFLVEQVPLVDVADDLNALPLTASTGNPSLRVKYLASGQRVFPPGHGRIADTNQILLAKSDLKPEPGVVLDYVTVNGLIGDEAGVYTFLGGTTYYISGPVYCSNPDFQSGTVIKYAAGSSFDIGGTATCPAATEPPAIFTAVDDDSIGDPIDGSSGSPFPSSYASPAFFMYSGGLSNVRVNYAYQIFNCPGSAHYTFAHCQFYNCDTVLNDTFDWHDVDVEFDNCLFENIGWSIVTSTSVDEDYDLLYLNNCTINNCGMLIDNTASSWESIIGVNTIFANVWTWISNETTWHPLSETASCSPCGYYNTPDPLPGTAYTTASYPFKTAGAANEYLAEGTFTNVGGAFFSDDLLAMTTFAPQDGGAPDNDGLADLGYHYPVNEDSDHDALPDWWEWKWFGNYSHSGSELDASGTTLLAEYQNYRNGITPSDPNIIAFSIDSEDDYVNHVNISLKLRLTCGDPAYYAIFTNSTSNTNWLPYSGPNLAVNLGPTDGVYNLVVGLKGIAPAAMESWHHYDVTLDRVAPTMAVTNPILSGATGTVIKPYLQLQGFANEQLSSVSYDIANALGTAANVNAFVTDQYFDRTRFNFTTNYFQAYDVPLTNGVNHLTLKVTDRAGNTTVTNFDVVLNYGLATTAPTVKLIWPQAGMSLSGSSCTIRGTMSDETGTIVARVVNGDNATVTRTGLVERNNMFWIENVPLNGTSQITIYATNSAGIDTNFTFTVSTASVNLSIDSTPTSADLWQPLGTVSGTVAPPATTVTINGVTATVDTQNDGNGGYRWSADKVPNHGIGTATFDASARNAQGTVVANVSSSVEMPLYYGVTDYSISGSQWTDLFSTGYRDYNLTFNKTYSAWFQPDPNDPSQWQSKYSGSGSEAGTWELNQINLTIAWNELIPEGGLIETTYPGVPQANPFGMYGDRNLYIIHYYAQGVQCTWLSLPESRNNIGYEMYYYATLDAHTRVKLYTGGKAQVSRQNLIRISVSGLEYNPAPVGSLACGIGSSIWGNPEMTLPAGIDPADLSVMGRQPNKDGDVWVELPDNSVQDITVTAAGKKHYYADAAPVKIPNIDLDVDSDNVNDLENSPYEDSIEDRAPGKYLSVNNGDADGDSIPDFADGYDLYGTPNVPGQSAQFIPLTLEIPADVDRAKAKVKISYSTSDPSQVNKVANADGSFTYTPASGIRIWIQDGGQFRKKAPIDNYQTIDGYAVRNGDYVAPKEYSATNIPSVLYVEGLTPGTYPITVDLDPDGQSGYISSDTVIVTVVNLDLDVDSDNNNGLNPPDRSAKEETIEDSVTLPGKIIGVNDGDIDEDGIPDFVDGYNFDGASGNADDRTSGNHLTPIVIEVPVGLDPHVAKLAINYSASDPKNVIYDSTAKTWTPAPGDLRIWLKDGDQSRNKADANAAIPGDFIAPATYALSQLGITASQNTITAYVEGIAPSLSMGDQRISIDLMPDGTIQTASDAARMTVLPFQLDIDSDNNNGFDLPSKDQAEREVRFKQKENLPNVDKVHYPGKILMVNGGDVDGDGVPDFADNLNVFQNDGVHLTGEEWPECPRFVPMTLHLMRPGSSYAGIKIRFTYSASDPANIQRTGSVGEYIYTPATGKLRIWKKDGKENRKVAAISTAGDYVAPNLNFEAADLGFDSTTDTVTLYVEAVDVSTDIADLEIKVTAGFDTAGTGQSGYPLISLVRVTALNLAVMKVDENNTVTKAQHVETSLATPVVTVNAVSVSQVRPSNDAQYIVGSLNLAGSIASAVADITPISAGKNITEVQVYLNDSEDPIGTIPVTFTKSEDLGSFQHPFPYAGSFAGVVANATLLEGANVIRVVAKDPLDEMEGYAEFSFDVEAISPFAQVGSPIAASLNVTLAGSLSASTVDSITATLNVPGIGSLVGQTLTETAADSRVFANAGNTFQITISSGGEILAAGQVDEISVVAAASTLGITELAFPLMMETGNDTKLFHQDLSGILISLNAALTGSLSTTTVDAVSATVTVPSVGSVSGTLTETAADSRVFDNAGGTFRITISSGGDSLDAGSVDEINAVATASALGINQLAFPMMRETGNDTTIFLQRIYGSDDAYESDYSGFTFVLSQVTPVGASHGGLFKPYLLQIQGPDLFLDYLQEIELADGPRLIQKSPIDGKYYVRMKNSPAVVMQFIAKRIQGGEPNLQAILGGLKDYANYKYGFAQGFFASGKGMVEGTWDLLQWGVDTSVWYNPAMITWRTSIGDTFETEKRYIQNTKETAQKLAEIYEAVAQDQITYLTALYTGTQVDPNDLSPYNTALQYTAEVIVEMGKDFAQQYQNDPQKRGFYEGYATFEILSIILPATKAGTLGKAVDKAALLTELKTRPFFSGTGKGAAAFVRLVDFLTRLQTTKMCFVAGTKVHTVAGLKNIEEVVLGDQVLSRDEATGEQSWKPVLDTITTHPSELYNIYYAPLKSSAPTATLRLDNETQAEAKLTATGEHPFYVSNRPQPGFVPARELEVGDEFLLSDGGKRTVTQVTVQAAAPGQDFTTYNLEVADFHTYFVGTDGVWVHNSAPNACVRVFGIFDNLMTRNGGDVWLSFATTRNKIGGVADVTSLHDSHVLRLKLFNQARARYFSGAAGGTAAPWWNLAVQDLSHTVPSSKILGQNMESVLGIKRPRWMSSHHIVEKLDMSAEMVEIRQILANANIHVDEAANGVWLPMKHMIDDYTAAGKANWLDGIGTQHEFVHTTDYKQAILARLQPLNGQHANIIRDALQRVGQEIVEGTFPW